MHTKFLDDLFRNSSNFKVIASTIWGAVLFHWWEGFITFNWPCTCIPGFMKLSTGAQKLLGRGYTHRPTCRQQGYLEGLLSFFQNKESRLKISTFKIYRFSTVILVSCSKNQFLWKTIICVNGPASLGGERSDLVTACPEPSIQKNIFGFLHLHWNLLNK
jgi:hypothetical protein